MISDPYTMMLPEQIEALRTELDALRHQEWSDRGSTDARYIQRLWHAVRWTGLTGRLALFFSFWWPMWGLGVFLLSLSKILDNMEVGHNVIHGQYDFLGDPRFHGNHYEWDIAGTSANWRTTHNYRHHTYTNIRGMDEDIGYGVLRLFPEQRWKLHHLLQPFYAIIFALLFQWGIAIQDLRIGQLFQGKKTLQQLRKDFAPVQKKISRLMLRDYILLPLIAGPMALHVLLGNIVANGIRNVWTFSVIFCGHFTRDVRIFPKSILNGEHQGLWYVRQILGSSNLKGGRIFHILTGNLSHQIEHHLFPDLPAWRYARIAPKVQALCDRYNLPYHRGRLSRQCLQVTWRILRHAFPSRTLQPVHQASALSINSMTPQQEPPYDAL